MSFWQFVFIILDVLFHAYLLFGLFYSHRVTKELEPTWNPLPTLKIMFWWPPVLIERKRRAHGGSGEL